MAKKVKKKESKKTKLGEENKQTSNVIETEEDVEHVDAKDFGYDEKENSFEPKKSVKFFTKQDVDEDEGTVTAIISTDAVDRDKEVLLPKGADIENFLKNPVVLWVHNSSAMPIGKALWIKKSRKKITAKVKFAKTELGQEVFEMFKGGFLNAFSVGFIIKKSHQPTPDEIRKKPELADAWRIFDEWELLEFSVVPVPANQEALATAVKKKELKLSDSTLEDMDLDVEEIFLTEDEQKKEEVLGDEEEMNEAGLSFESGKKFIVECVTCKHFVKVEKGAAACDAEKCIHEKEEEDNNEIEVIPVDVEIKTVDIKVEPVNIKVIPIIDVKAVASEEIKRIKGIVYD